MSNTTDEVHQRPIHVLEIIGNAIVGGMEHYVRNLISHLPKEQFRVTCLCPFESPFTRTLRELGSQVFITPISDDPPWRSIQLAVEVIRHQHIDLIHAHMPKAHALAGLAGCLTHTPALATVHGMHVTAQELGITRVTGTHLIAVCQDAYSQALALGVQPERVTFIPNGVDLEQFTPQRSGDNFRRALGIPRTAPLVGFVARIDWDKGPDLFVRVAHLVHLKRPQTHFAMIGEGALDEQVATLVKQLGLQNCVHLGGAWPNTWDVYPAFDVQVSTSRSEGMPLALLEGMACGRPIVAMAVGGVPEVVEYGSTGLLVPPGDADEAASAIVKLLDNPARRCQMEQASRRRVVENFDLQVNVALTSALFQRMVGRDSKTSLLVPTRAPRLESKAVRSSN